MIRTIVFKLIFSIFLISQLTACSSIKTVTSSNEKIGFDLYREKSKCKYSTRIYSGVTYNFCLINAKPSGSTYDTIWAPWILVDLLVLSPIADTVLLPVSITQQVLYGNPKVYKPRSY